MSSTTRSRKPSTTPSRTTPPRTTGSSTPTKRGTGRWWLAAAAVVVAAGGIGIVVSALGQDNAGEGEAGSAPYVGGDLHVLASIDERLYVGGHDGAAASTDAGRTWTAIDSLRGADPMGWAVTSDAMLIGGHPGLFRSTDNGSTFSIVGGENAIPDVHALGGSGTTAYLGSPVQGFMASDDGGRTWESRNSQVGQGFMGTLLVDPTDPNRIIAPDMSNGVVASTDGGATWSALGGPGGTMSLAWDPTDTNRLISIGMSESAVSTDGGRTWTPVQVPQGTSAAAFSPDGETLYTAALSGVSAVISASTDDGNTWTRLN